MGGYKRERVSEMLLSFLGEQIQRLNDPKLEFVTLSAVCMSADLKTARVYWTSLRVQSKKLPISMDNEEEDAAASKMAEDFPTADELSDVQESLSRARNMLQRRIGAELKLRFTPRLIFCYDDSLLKGSRVDSLLRQAGF